MSAEERQELLGLTRRGKLAARKVKRAQILLLAEEGKTDKQIAEMLHVGVATVERTRQRFVLEGFSAALHERPRPRGRRKLDAKAEAVLETLAQSEPPEGRKRWTLQLLADRLVELKVVDSIADEAVRMVAETRQPLPAQPGQPVRYDYEYRRNGTCNLFLHFQPLAGWRKVKVTQQRTKQDFAHCLKELVEVDFPAAEKIRLVVDNLNTHSPAALYETFEPAEAHRLARKLEFHYTPKHGSWLNMAEIELSVLEQQCLDRWLPDIDTVRSETAAWQAQRNQQRATVDWQFTTDKARIKLKRLYPSKS